MAGLFGSKSAAADAMTAGDAAVPDRRKLLLVGGLGLVLVAAFAVLVLPMLLGGSDDSSSGPIASSPRSRTAVTPSPSATPSPEFVLAPAAAYGDPFAPLPEESAAAAAASAMASAAPTVPSAGTPSTTGSAVGDTTGKDATTTSGATTTGSAASAATADNAPATGKPVEIIAIKGGQADIKIDSKPYSVQAGQSPATGYTVISIADSKITISHGGTSHILSVGELQTF
jgi:hypothetical protein